MHNIVQAVTRISNSNDALKRHLVIPCSYTNKPMFFLSTRRSSSSSSSSSSSGSGSGSSSDSNDSPVGPSIAAQVAKLKELTKHSRPIYEDYMPTSPAESPAATDSDNSNGDIPSASKHQKRVRQVSSSDNDSGVEKIDNDEAFRRQIVKLSSYLEANAGKKKKVQHDEKDNVGKEASGNEHKKKKQARKGVDVDEEAEEPKAAPVKKQKVIAYSDRPTTKKPPTGLTFKQRKSLQTSLTQLTKLTEKIVGIARDA